MRRHPLAVAVLAWGAGWPATVPRSAPGGPSLARHPTVGRAAVATVRRTRVAVDAGARSMAVPTGLAEVRPNTGPLALEGPTRYHAASASGTSGGWCGIDGGIGWRAAGGTGRARAGQRAPRGDARPCGGLADSNRHGPTDGRPRGESRLTAQANARSGDPLRVDSRPGTGSPPLTVAEKATGGLNLAQFTRGPVRERLGFARPTHRIG